MIPSADLFDLIRSLSKTEKGYFKKYSRLHVRGKNNNYILLFDAIERQKKSRSGGYNEQALLLKFKDYDFTRKFAVAKNYLYNQVLYSLESYHQSIHTEVRSLIHRTELLYAKGLYKQALKSLVKAKETAKTNDMHWAMLELFRHWEMSLALKNMDSAWAENIMREEAEELALVQNTKIYRDLFFKIGIHHNIYGIVRNKKHLQEIEKIIRSPYLKDGSKAKTFEARLRFYDAHCFYAQTKGNAKGTYGFVKKIIEHYKMNPEKIRQNTSSYIGYVNNLMVACMNAKKSDEIPGCLLELASLTPFVKSSVQKTQLFYTINYTRLNYLNSTGQFTEAVFILIKMKKQLPEFENELGNIEKIILYANVAVSHFGAGEYRNCLLWLNRIRNEISFTVRPDMESFLRLFYIIVHFEAGNTELLPSLIQSAYRFLRKKERLYKFETHVVGFFRKQQSADTKEKLINIFKKLKSDISPLQKDKFEKNAFEYFDFISWLDSKIENKPFSEILKRKRA